MYMILYVMCALVCLWEEGREGEAEREVETLNKGILCVCVCAGGEG